MELGSHLQAPLIKNLKGLNLLFLNNFVEIFGFFY
jgi:hypothetical protein